MSKSKLIVLFVLLVFVFSGCGDPTSAQIEQSQQELANKQIVRNQPPPDLGGWSFERHIVTELYKARNRTISTYTYTIIEYTGQIVEVCPSIGYPIPYSTQLTNPEKIEDRYQSGYAILPNPEPNGLYPPSSAEATIINCVNPDGSLSPVYFEPRVFASPFKIKADRIIERVDDKNSFSVTTK